MKRASEIAGSPGGGGRPTSRILLRSALLAALLVLPYPAWTAAAHPAVHAAPASVAVAQDSAQELLTETKLALFDGKWREALRSAQRLQSNHPQDRRLAQAIYYEAEALAGLERKAEALGRYQAALQSRDGSLSDALTEGANLSLVELSVSLWQEGEKEHVGLARRALSNENPRVRYFAALSLSYLNDKPLARRGVPVLNEILDDEEGEIRDRAYLALMRIDPRLARSARRQSEKGLLRISVESDGEEVLSLSFPLSLARALLASIPDEAKEEMRRNGIENADQLLEELMKSQTSVLEFRSKEGRFRIWIE